MLHDVSPVHGARLVATAIREALIGSRALHQIRPWLSPRAFEQLAHYTDTLLLRPGLLGGLRIQCPRPGVAEAVGTVLAGSHWLALCLRLELGERWTCSELRLLGVSDASWRPFCGPLGSRRPGRSASASWSRDAWSPPLRTRPARNR